MYNCLITTNTYLFYNYGGKINEKISVLIALILCVTIGGVYAAWAYTGNTVSTADRTLSHGMATATTEGDMGTLKVTENKIDIKIDQKATGDYHAVLVITGEITVTFDPKDGAPQDVVDNAIPAKCYLSAKNLDANKYGESAIYKISDNYIELEWEPQTDGTFTATVTDEQIGTLISLGSEDFILDTHDEWQTFHDLEKGITITAYFAQIQ